MVWVALDADEVVGYCYASEVDDSLFVEEIDVVPEHGRRGVGRALLRDVDADVRRRALTAVTLTTESDVPWNRPLYEKLGFRVVAPDERHPGLAAKFTAEADRGLDLTTRVTMRRDVSR